MRLRLQSSLKIAFIASLFGLVVAAITEEKYLLIISIINLILSIYLVSILR